MYTEEQIKELEDKLINALSPVHGYIEMYKGKVLPKTKADSMLSRLNFVVEYIRNMRPEHERYKRRR
jgi:hypothetical protein